MKKILGLIIIALVIISCETEPKFFTVSGEINNANGEKLYFIELQSKNIVLLDSVILSNDGTFSFKGQTDIPKFYALRTSANNYLTLIVNPFEQIIIKATSIDLANNSIIEGSQDSQNILILRSRLNKSVQQLDSLGLYYQSIIGTPEINKVKDSLQLRSQEIIEEHSEFTKEFIQKNSNSLASLMALYQQFAPRRYILNPKDHMEYFTLVDSSLMQMYPESDAVITLHNQMIEIKRQQSNDAQINNIVGIGQIAPNINLPTPDGDTIALSSLRGKYVLLDFWASWCKPCRIENPNLVSNYTKYNEKGFEIYQVSLDKNIESWTNAIEKDDLNWTHVSDLQYWESAPAKVYQVQSIPSSFLLDKKGTIIAKNLRGDALEAKLSELFD
jgi:peroxiredoxin